MGLNAKKVKAAPSGVQQAALEAGTYPCRVVQVIDLGVQPQRAFEGKPKPPKQTIRLTYEVTDEFNLDEDGKEQLDKPRWVSEDIPFNPLSSDLAASTKRYKAIDPNDESDGDFTLLLGRPCNVTLTCTPDKKDAEKFYNNIAAVTSMRPKDAAKCAELVNPTLAFLISEPTKESWEALPTWLQDKIKDGLEFRGSELDAMLGGKPAGQAKPEGAALEPADPEPELDENGDVKKPW